LRLSRKSGKALKRLALALFVAGIAAGVLLPLFMGTQTYPVTVVQGYSMYPALQTGDLVIFHRDSQPVIPNGTIIIFVQGGTGISALDSLMRPVLIHRIVGEVAAGNGTVNYETKGDNNQLPDPEVVTSNRILGTPEIVIPKVGFAIMFVQSPQGLVTIVGMITFVYLGRNEKKAEREEAKESFLGALAQMSLNGELSDAVFRKFELAVKYVQGIELDGIMDGRILSLVDWVRKGGLDTGWKLSHSLCPVCSSSATNFECSNGLLLTICPYCSSKPR